MSSRSTPLAVREWPSDQDIGYLGRLLRLRLDGIREDPTAAIEAGYRGALDPNSSEQAVYVHDEHGRRPLLHLTYHSPTGLSWGYPGSGPADLALSLLHDCTVRAISCGERERRLEVSAQVDGWPLTDRDAGLAQQLANMHHQGYKTEVIAGMPIGAGWSMPERAVLEWLVLAVEP